MHDFRRRNADTDTLLRFIFHAHMSLCIGRSKTSVRTGTRALQVIRQIYWEEKRAISSWPRLPTFDGRVPIQLIRDNSVPHVKKAVTLQPIHTSYSLIPHMHNAPRLQRQLQLHLHLHLHLRLHLRMTNPGASNPSPSQQVSPPKPKMEHKPPEHNFKNFVENHGASPAVQQPIETFNPSVFDEVLSCKVFTVWLLQNEPTSSWGHYHTKPHHDTPLSPPPPFFQNQTFITSIQKQSQRSTIPLQTEVYYLSDFPEESSGRGMSRIIRLKHPAIARKVAQRRNSSSSSSLDLSDDGGYSGVEDISDSEDNDEKDVDAAEEEHIITRVLQPSNQSSPRSHSLDQDDQADAENDDGQDADADTDADDDDDDDDDDEEDEDDEEEEYDDDGQVGAVDEPASVDLDDGASWDGIVSEVDEAASSDNHATPYRAAPERHVRFVDVPSSDSDSTDTDDDHADFFPDLFVDQSSLDPSFRREIEQDDDASSTTSGSCWDFHGVYEYNLSGDADVEAITIIQELEEDVTPVATRFPLQDAPDLLPAADPVPSHDDVQELDGYETDGDTTEEEEDMPPPSVRRRQMQSARAVQSDESDTGKPIKGRRGQPRVGRFHLDSSERKPIAVVNPISRKMMIFTPHRRRQLDLSPEQFELSPFGLQPSPMVGNSAHIMMSAMSSTGFALGDFFDTHTMGPAEAFFPADDSSDMGMDMEDEDDAERSLDIDDFITFEAGSQADEPAGDDWCRSDALASTPARPTTASSDIDMLSHINASNVGAFRRDQINQRLILSEKATQDSLAFSSPYNYTALRGIKSDRFETAAVPLTPMRRQKRQMQEFARSPLESVSQKRKASGEHSAGHKRHRSISDVNQLRI
ncbi:hypothetical protein SODALDRAFT_376887 [Sodiomyces alkalinus F11]|uniref:Uncharacterized protein n=1 Tax=Sodiomyces alkalinus (strain CBS 110278 / VKM F-3762 / F11) TaxID=1314773 RepID=A0A3N2Q391_SODAK|nr:hypothetical protein SODALDRAFT_376887 [Sodiomyces alkalinus F11]ROT41186.1 hypothetical protein SODALDRAFT_376887 [Sodiomyces alkalinus F11]